MSEKNEYEIMMDNLIADLKAAYDSLPFRAVSGDEDVKRFEEMMPSHDGVRLRTIYTLPADAETESGSSEAVRTAPGGIPVIVQRCCYPRNERKMDLISREYAKRGFGFVLQFCRGTGGSEGVWEPNVNDRADGLFLMEHLNSLPWIASLGYQGASYMAFTGWIMADAMPEKVKAMYLTVYGTDRHTSAYKDGLFRQDILTGWAMGNAGRPIEADYLTSAAYRPQIEVDEALWGGELSWYRDWISHTSRTDPYWNEGLWKQLREIPAKVKIPLYIVDGWYDHHLGSALRGYETLNDASKEHSVLKIGPWNHVFHPAVFGHPDQKNGFSTGEADMFDWFYKILVNGEIPEKRVDWYVIGKDRWETFPAYPVVTGRKKEFFLAPGGRLAEEAPEKVRDDEILSRSYIYDPEDPVMSHGAESLFTSQEEVGSLLQPEPDSRPDIISFVSEPLKEDLTIVGKPTAELYVSSDAEDTCFTVKIMEVFEDGNAYNIRNGITTLAYRNGSQDRITYTPGTVEKIRIETWDVAWMAKKGSRIRVDISSSDFPEYAVHPNKAGVWSMIRDTVKAEQTIYFGPDMPSRLILPAE